MGYEHKTGPSRPSQKQQVMRELLDKVVGDDTSPAEAFVDWLANQYDFDIDVEEVEALLEVVAGMLRAEGDVSWEPARWRAALKKAKETCCLGKLCSPEAYNRLAQLAGEAPHPFVRVSNEWCTLCAGSGKLEQLLHPDSPVKRVVACPECVARLLVRVKALEQRGGRLPLQSDREG
jgi:hypothetical protein